MYRFSPQSGANGLLAQSLFDGVNNARVIRRGARRKTRQYTAVWPDQKFLEVPGDIAGKLSPLTGQ
jgi:hypothetical protein